MRVRLHRRHSGVPVSFRPFLIGLVVALCAAVMTSVQAQEHQTWAKAYTGYIKSTLNRRGYSNSDPRTGATIRGLYNAARSYPSRGAASYMRVMGRLNPWVQGSIVVGSGIVMYGVVGGGIEIPYFGETPTSPAPHVEGDKVYRWRVSGSSYYGTSMPQVLAHDYATRTIYGGMSGYRVNATSPVSNPETSCDPFIYHVQGVIGRTEDGDPLYGPLRNVGCTIMSEQTLCRNNQLWHNTTGSCIDDRMDEWYIPLPAGVQEFTDFEEWYDSLTEYEKDLEASAEMIAEVANQMWADASANFPEPGAVPFNANRPVTRGDIPPEGRPSLRELFETPFPEWGWDEDPEPAPGTITPDPEAPPAVNLGEDPGIENPELEEAPSDLMAPLVDELEPFHNLNLSVPGAQCPQFEESITVRGHTWNIDISAHCQFIDPYYSMIYAVMLAGWGLTAFWIVMEA